MRSMKRNSIFTNALICFSIILVILFISKIYAIETIIISNLNEKNVIYKQGKVEQQVSPCSTFKIALSLIGFDFGILQDELNPKWQYNENYKTSNELWKSIHYPQIWIQHSCVWFSKELVKKLGFENFKNYISMLRYGNQDISGDTNLNNGYLQCWLSSSLKISPIEQLDFLQNLLTHNLPFTPYAQEMTKNILFIEDVNGYKLFGKTGTGFQNNGYELGWFIGWITKLDKTLIFVILVQDDKTETIPAGIRAKEKIKAILKNFT